MVPSHDPLADARALLRLHRPPRLWWLRMKRPLCVRCGQYCTRRHPCGQAFLSRHQIGRPDPCPPANLGPWNPPVARGVAQVPAEEITPPARHMAPERPQPMYPWVGSNPARGHYTWPTRR